MEIRNIAIIAHVDHGKTTLTDALMRQCGVAEEGVSMDSNALEQERGITIYSKNTSVFYKGSKINIVDTPGHADFGSEVERVLKAIDSVLLVVDAKEGPMPQTKFVLKKSLELGLKPIVVINKIDKPAADPAGSAEKVYELFLDLGATDAQLDFVTVYANAKAGLAKLKLEDESQDLSPLLDTILKKVAVASSMEKSQKELLVQPFNLAYDNYLGRLGISRIYQGILKNGANVVLKNNRGKLMKGKITKLYTFHGLKRKEVEAATTGDIVIFSGLPEIEIGDTVCAAEKQEPLSAINIDEPTIVLNFLVNDSPFAGKEGNRVTTREIKERLEKELEVNVGLKVDFSFSDRYIVSGRGELHIAILLENMRREGYEVQVSKPEVIIKTKNSQKLEPYEELTIDVPSGSTGKVIEKLAKRKGKMLSMNPEGDHAKMIFEIPTRGLLGYRNEFIIDTKGEGILYSRVIGFKPWAGAIERHEFGSLISMAAGKALAYALYNLQNRGAFYIGPTTEVYEGMVIGNVVKEKNDLEVNPTKGKKLTNIRAAGSDENVILAPPVKLTLERGLGMIKDDEYLEVTPISIRLRKQFLSEIERIRSKRKQKNK